MSQRIIRALRDLARWIKQPTHIALICIFIIAIGLRFWNTPDRFGFDKDPTRDVLVTEYIASSWQLPLVGPSSGIAPFPFGPWYYYELAIFRLFVPTVYAAFYFVPLFSLIFVYLMFLIGKNLKDELLGLILAGFAAITPSQVGPTSGLSNPNLIPPHAAATILIFIIMMSKKRSAWLAFVWGIILGIGINHHYQLVPFLIFPFIAFLRYLRSSFLSLLFFIAGLILTFIPMLIFLSKNNFETINNIVSFAFHGNGVYIPNSWMIYIKDFWLPYWSYVIGVPLWLGIVLAIVVVGVYSLLIWQRKVSSTHVILGIIFAVLFIALRFASFQREYYYFLFLLPLLLLFIGFVLRFVWELKGGKFLVTILVAILLLTSFPMNKIRLNSPEDNKNIRLDVANLYKHLHSSGVVIYNCKDNQINRAEGFTFYLIRDKLFNPQGQKIAFQNNYLPCPFPENTQKEVASNVFDITTMSDESLEKDGWFKITPHAVYTKTFGIK